MLFSVLSRLGSICRGLASAEGLACYSISDQALPVSTEAWHAILYLITPWQYLPRAWHAILYLITRIHALAVSAEAWHAIAAILYLVTPWQYLQRLGMLFYILLRLGSICTGLACYSIFYHTLAVSAGAWHTILYLITPWQYPPRLGILFYI